VTFGIFAHGRGPALVDEGERYAAVGIEGSEQSTLSCVGGVNCVKWGGWAAPPGIDHDAFICNSVGNAENGRSAASMDEERHTDGAAAVLGDELGDVGSGPIGRRLEPSGRRERPCLRRRDGGRGSKSLFCAGSTTDRS
jgi:hypothetical protein